MRVYNENNIKCTEMNLNDCICIDKVSSVEIEFSNGNHILLDQIIDFSFDDKGIKIVDNLLCPSMYNISYDTYITKLRVILSGVNIKTYKANGNLLKISHDFFNLKVANIIGQFKTDGMFTYILEYIG